MFVDTWLAGRDHWLEKKVLHCAQYNKQREFPHCKVCHTTLDMKLDSIKKHEKINSHIQKLKDSAVQGDVAVMIKKGAKRVYKVSGCTRAAQICCSITL